MALLFEEETYRILGACFEVYKEKGCGFLEAVYQECLEIELSLQGIPFQPQSELQLSYKGCLLKQRYTPDFICFGNIIVEVKAVSALVNENRAQLHNYLKATGHRVGLLVTSATTPRSNTKGSFSNSIPLLFPVFFSVFSVYSVVSLSALRGPFVYRGKRPSEATHAIPRTLD
jgi:GxxExxY protein